VKYCQRAVCNSFAGDSDLVDGNAVGCVSALRSSGAAVACAAAGVFAPLPRLRVPRSLAYKHSKSNYPLIPLRAVLLSAQELSMNYVEAEELYSWSLGLPLKITMKRREPL
jgi:hypothetical protein